MVLSAPIPPADYSKLGSPSYGSRSLFSPSPPPQKAPPAAIFFSEYSAPERRFCKSSPSSALIPSSFTFASALFRQMFPIPPFRLDAPRRGYFLERSARFSSCLKGSFVPILIYAVSSHVGVFRILQISKGSSILESERSFVFYRARAGAPHLEPNEPRL